MARVRSSFKLRPHTELTIILDDLDFSWHQHEIDLAAELWDSGVSIADIAKQVRPAAYPLRTARDSDPRQVIYEIKKASGCDSVIYPGQVVRVPK